MAITPCIMFPIEKNVGTYSRKVAQSKNIFREKGAGVVNCDTIAHDLYRPGLPLNSTIAEAFGRDVITDQGEVDRAKLGQIVFSDQVIMLLRSAHFAVLLKALIFRTLLINAT